MGAAGVLLLGSFVFFALSIKSWVLFLIWKNKPKADAYIKELKSSTVNYKSETSNKVVSSEYLYAIEIRDGNTVKELEYKEVISGYKYSKLAVGSLLPVFYNKERNTFKFIKSLKDDMWQYPLGMLVCITLFVIIAIIVINIQ